MSRLNATKNKQAEQWATTLANHILLRRQQTQAAYQSQTQRAGQGNDGIDSAKSNNETDNLAPLWMFNVLTTVLVEQLEQGHTVLILNQTKEETKKTYPNWQMQLYQTLVMPIADLLQNIISKDNSEKFTEVLPAAQFLHQPAQNAMLNKTWQQVKITLFLHPIQIAKLEQRLTLCNQLLKYLNEYNKTYKNSLSNFSHKIQLKELIEKLEKNNQNAPILIKENYDPPTLILWLNRSWHAEHILAEQILRLSSHQLTPLDIKENNHLNQEQKQAVNTANTQAFCIITGGPGTGKTYTVAQLVMALKQESNQQAISLALAAPTGKAAQRMQESLQQALQNAKIDIQLQEAKTIHRLLGIGEYGKPRYHQNNPLSEDVVIVDEASMLGVELANYLVSAIKTGARLILLGDANQLAAVEAGAVLADLCQIKALKKQHAMLKQSKRFSDDSGIGRLAEYINQTDTDFEKLIELLNQHEQLAFYNTLIQNQPNQSNRLNSEVSQLLQHNFADYIEYTNSIINRQDWSIGDLFARLNQFKVLTAGHHGTYGDYFINDYVTTMHKQMLKLPATNGDWYHGRPIMVLQNNYELALFNGDIGICIQTANGLNVFFDNKQSPLPVNLLSDAMVSTAYAMTIHKSQGSEFDHVAVMFNDTHHRLLSKELIYTGVTRAKNKVSVCSSKTALKLAVSTPTQRQTGLAIHFADILNKKADVITSANE